MIRSFTFRISLPPSLNVLSLKYISSEVSNSSSIIYPTIKINSEKPFVSESRTFLNTFFNNFFKEFPELKVSYNDFIFLYSGIQIKDSELCEDVFQRNKELKTIYVFFTF